MSCCSANIVPAQVLLKPDHAWRDPAGSLVMIRWFRGFAPILCVRSAHDRHFGL